MEGHAASYVYFGLNPMWVSTCVLAVTYAIIISEKVNRSIVALVGAGADGRRRRARPGGGDRRASTGTRSGC